MGATNMKMEKMAMCRRAYYFCRALDRSDLGVVQSETYHAGWGGGDPGVVVLRGTMRDVKRVLRACGSKASLYGKCHMNHGPVWYRARVKVTEKILKKLLERKEALK